MTSDEVERRTARATGWWYLALAITGIASFLVIRPMILDADDAAVTLANIRSDEWLAYLGLGLELGIVAAQALAAVWFYKLLRPLNEAAAWATGMFGMANAMAILTSAAAVATALQVASESAIAPGGDVEATTLLLFALSANAWGVGSLFFGLWLIPMGWVAARSGRFPPWLGWTLIAGGAGYFLSAFVDYGIADAPRVWVDALAALATVGEFWMIGYLLIVGIRPASSATAREA